MALALPADASGPSNQAKLFPLRPLAIGEYAQNEVEKGISVGAPPACTGRPAAAVRHMRNMEGTRQTTAAMMASICT